VLEQRTYTPSHHLIQLADAASPSPITEWEFPASGVLFGTAGVAVTVASDTAVCVTVGTGGGQRRGERLAESLLMLSAAGLDLGDPPSGSDVLIAWPAGRTQVVVYGPAGDPYARTWIRLMLTPLDATAVSDETLDAQIKRLAARLGNNVSQHAAAATLKRIGDPAKPLLKSMLADKQRSAEERFGAAHALSLIGGPDVVESLLTALTDPHPWVRRGAANAMYELPRPLKDDRIVPALLAAMYDDGERVAWVATLALGRHGDQRALPALTAVLDGPPSELDDAALYALVDIGDSSILPVVQRVLERCERGEWGPFTPNVRIAAERARDGIQKRSRRRRP
jgi:hypothetical protein